MYYIPFNSRVDYHKSPFGAVRCGEKTVFRVILLRSLGCSGVSLCIYSQGKPEQRVEMSWECMQGEGEEWWRAEFAAQSTGIYYYYFSIRINTGNTRILKYESSLGKIGEEGSPWQLTVYSPQLQTPDWVKGSLMYQIFPDRFCFSGEEKANVPGDRVLRSDWGGEPLWEPDGEGRITKYDYFKGDFKGIESKLDYLSELGVGCIYLNPIFSAHSNHRYDTADYMQPDCLLGTAEDFARLCKKARSKGIRIILDGVFSHTGADSVYFNKFRRYDSSGAYNSKSSPYYEWYSFSSFPDEYACWWGVDILPETREDNPSFLDFITGENGVLRRWMRLGASGWRLDVADELPDAFLDSLRACVKDENPEAYILGEVWEDASNKISYGSLRRYLLGEQLDSVMNYPFAQAIIAFVCSGVAEGFNEKVAQVTENYPKPCVDTLMNHIGTHDTCRILARLALADRIPHSHLDRYRGELSSEQRERALKLLRLTACVQFALPGVPCIYYGDEAGLCGGEDPFNRGCFPWGDGDESLIDFYRTLGKIRRGHRVFADGSFVPVSCVLGCVAFERRCEGERAILVANRNEHEITYTLPGDGWEQAESRLECDGSNIVLPPLTAAILFKNTN